MCTSGATLVFFVGVHLTLVFMVGVGDGKRTKTYVWRLSVTKGDEDKLEKVETMEKV